MYVLMLLMSLLAGSIIGIERQWRNKIAGIRTMTLVSVGATIFVSLSTMVANDSSATRIAAQVVSGIGFLAGGVIVRDGFSISGLNTAATLWCTAAVGSMIGAGFILEGCVAALTITLVNIVIRFVSHHFNKFAEGHGPQQGAMEEDRYFLIVTAKSESEVLLRTEIINQLDFYYLAFSHFECKDLANNKVQLQVEIEPAPNASLAMKQIIANLSKNENTLEIHQL